MKIVEFRLVLENSLGERFTVSDADSLIREWSMDVGEMSSSGACRYTVEVTAYGKPHGVEKLFTHEAKNISQT